MNGNVVVIGASSIWGATAFDWWQDLPNIAEYDAIILDANSVFDYWYSAGKIKHYKMNSYSIEKIDETDNKIKANLNLVREQLIELAEFTVDIYALYLPTTIIGDQISDDDLRKDGWVPQVKNEPWIVSTNLWCPISLGTTIEKGAIMSVKDNSLKEYFDGLKSWEYYFVNDSLKIDRLEGYYEKRWKIVPKLTPVVTSKVEKPIAVKFQLSFHRWAHDEEDREGSYYSLPEKWGGRLVLLPPHDASSRKQSLELLVKLAKEAHEATLSKQKSSSEVSSGIPSNDAVKQYGQRKKESLASGSGKGKVKSRFVFITTFTRYTAKRVIGEGGCGQIFEVVDEDGEVYAVKWLDPAKATHEKVKRFKNELQFCLRNRHCNILTISDHGVFIEGQAETPFYVMPLFNGSLRDLMKTGMSPENVLKYYSQILDGVEAAHKLGVVHRDIKPENILYDKNGDRLVVADFGIARFREDELYTAVETKDTVRLANFQYAAPEQKSRGGEVDQRTDIYALGLILNEMFTGTIPSGTSYRTIGSVAHDYEYLDSIVEEMMRQSLKERMVSIEELKNILIGRKNEFIVRQKLSELNGTVVQVTEADDPLIADPPRIINVDWNEGLLILIFQRPVNDKWIQALNNMGNHSSILGKGPEAFKIKGDKAIIGAQEKEVQQIIKYFHEWLPKANAVYKQTVVREKKAAEEEYQKQLQKKIENEEARQRILKNIKLPKP